jgi:hypothetical protein
MCLIGQRNPGKEREKCSRAAIRLTMPRSPPRRLAPALSLFNRGRRPMPSFFFLKRTGIAVIFRPSHEFFVSRHPHGGPQVHGPHFHLSPTQGPNNPHKFLPEKKTSRKLPCPSFSRTRAADNDEAAGGDYGRRG